MTTATTQEAQELKVGMGVTYNCGSDRYAYTVVEVVNAKTLRIRKDKARRVDGNGSMSDQQRYMFVADEQGEVLTITQRKNTLWYPKGESIIRGCYYTVGKRVEFSDPCF